MTAEPTMQPEHHINDLRETVSRVREVFAKCRDACPPSGSPPEVEARWEGSFVALRAMLLDELAPLLDAWEAGHPAWRSTELMLEGREAEIPEIVREVTSTEPSCSG